MNIEPPLEIKSLFIVLLFCLLSLPICAQEPDINRTGANIGNEGDLFSTGTMDPRGRRAGDNRFYTQQDRNQVPTPEQRAQQAGFEAAHQLSVISNRAWPAYTIVPREEEHLKEQLRLMRTLPQLGSCANLLEQCFEKLKSAIRHYEKADRKDNNELRIGTEENKEAGLLLRQAVSCMRSFASIPGGIVMPAPGRRRPVLSGNTENTNQNQNIQQLPPVAPNYKTLLQRHQEDDGKCPQKPVATTSWTPGYPPPSTEFIDRNIRARFFRQYPTLEPSSFILDVFQAISPQVLSAYPGLFTTEELMFDIRNLGQLAVQNVPAWNNKSRRTGKFSFQPIQVRS